jgi:hypothetical protein
MKKKITTECNNILTITHYLNDVIHNDDGPAVTTVENGLTRHEYYKHGVLLRRDMFNGARVWYDEKGDYHRVDGPAVIWSDETKQWYMHGKRHRIGGPAIEWKNGSREWYVNDQLHRTDGPAIELVDGTVEWWVNNVKQHRTPISKKALFVMSSNGCLNNHGHVLKYYKMIRDIGEVYTKFPDMRSRKSNTGSDEFFMSNQGEVFNITNTFSKYVAVFYKNNLHRFTYHQSLSMGTAIYPYKKFHVYDRTKSAYIFSAGSIYDALYKLLRLLRKDSSINEHCEYVIQPEYEVPQYLYISYGELENHIVRNWAGSSGTFNPDRSDLHKVKQCRFPLLTILGYAELNLRAGNLRNMDGYLMHTKLQKKVFELNNVYRYVDGLPVPQEKK